MTRFEAARGMSIALLAAAALRCGGAPEASERASERSADAAGDGGTAPVTVPASTSADPGLDAAAPPPALPAPAEGGVAPPPLQFPRLAGMLIGNPKNYDEPAYQAKIAKLDLAVLGMYFGWKRNGKTPAQVTAAIRALNPRIHLANYSIMTEAGSAPNPASDYKRNKLAAEKGPNGIGDWWAYDKDGAHTDWSGGSYGTWDVNLTLQTTPDANGDHWPEWLASADYTHLFDGQGFDLWYCDNNFWRPRSNADWDRDGTNDSRDDIAVRNAYRDGERAYYERAKSVAPHMQLIVNADSDLSGDKHPASADRFTQFEKTVHYGFMEHAIGASYSAETYGGFAAVLGWYRSLLSNVLEPGGAVLDAKLTGATDFKTLRYAFALALLDDGYLSVSTNYNEIVWFDEFDLAGSANTKWLGAAIEPPPAAPFANGVWRRRFEHGMALVNPKGNGPQTVAIEAGYAKIKGSQVPSINDGSAVTTVTLSDRDGLLLVVASSP